MNYISLGYFCSIALDLERLGLRTESSPFDWCISDFEGIIESIQNNFSDYLDYDLLAQKKDNHAIYTNIKYNIGFYHDFDAYTPLKDQLQRVTEKYNRRINRFYKTITSPTLFIRYISDEELVDGVSKELIYIEKNYEKILKLLKSFNDENDILFIANDGVSSSKFSIYNVPKDKNDLVSRTPIYTNPELYKKFCNVNEPNKKANLEYYRKKEKIKNGIIYRLKRKTIAIYKRLFFKKYNHYLKE